MWCPVVRCGVMRHRRVSAGVRPVNGGSKVTEVYGVVGGFMGGLKRSKSDRWILGVCGGIGQATGVGGNWVRLAAVLLAVLLPGVGILVDVLVYIALGILLPESDYM